MRKVQKQECPCCGRMISMQNYNSHVSVCVGVVKNEYGIHNFKKCDDGKYECPYCKKHFSEKGISTHVWRKHGDGKKHNSRKNSVYVPAWNKGLILYDDEFYSNVDKFKSFLIEKCDVYAESTLRNHFKKHLLAINGNVCSICGHSEWMNKPIPLVCDHIDGNPYNNSYSNFRLVCGNCDMQLPTYKSKNLGKGRKLRKN